MKKYELRFRNGDLHELRELENEGWACPVCGTIWEVTPPIYPHDGVLGHSLEYSSEMTHDCCGTCGVQYGYDFLIGPVAPPGFAARLIANIRTAWLDRVVWDPAALKQLEVRLGVTEHQARAEADEARRMP